MKPAVARNARGFTLVEVLVAFVFLTVMLSAVLDTLAAANRGNAATGRYLAAMSLAQGKMEEIKNSDFIQVQNVTKTLFAGAGDGYGQDGFFYAVAVSGSGLLQKTVAVTVYYHDAGVPREITFTGDLARR